MTMSASVILTNLPRDASKALKGVEEMDQGKGMYRSTFVLVFGSSFDDFFPFYY